MRYLTIALALFALVPACSGPRQPVQARTPEVRRLEPDAFARLLEDTTTLLVNAESAPAGEIPGTKLLSWGARVLDTMKTVQPDVTRPIAVYCRQGLRSDSLAVQLARAGYSNICVLQGGYRAWVERGLPFRLYDRAQ